MAYTDPEDGTTPVVNDLYTTNYVPLISAGHYVGDYPEHHDIRDWLTSEPIDFTVMPTQMKLMKNRT